MLRTVLQVGNAWPSLIVYDSEGLEHNSRHIFTFSAAIKVTYGVYDCVWGSEKLRGGSCFGPVIIKCIATRPI